MMDTGLSPLENLPEDAFAAVGGFLRFSDVIALKPCSRRLSALARTCLCADERWAVARQSATLSQRQRGWALMEAIHRSEFDCVEAAIRSGIVGLHDPLALPRRDVEMTAADVSDDAVIEQQCHTPSDKEEWTTALHVAVEQPAMLDFMLKTFPDARVNTRLRDRTTPLMQACRLGDRCVESVRLLCEFGCDVLATDREGNDALWIAEYECYHYDYGRVPKGMERVGDECAKALRDFETLARRRTRFSRHE